MNKTSKTSTQSKLQKFMASKSFKPIMFIAVFAVIGGGYMIYRSYAYFPVTYMNVGQKGVAVKNAFKTKSPTSASVVKIKPGGVVDLSYYPLQTGRYDICFKARAMKSVDKTKSTLTLDADNSTNDEEKANGYSQYSIRFTKTSVQLANAGDSFVQKGKACTSFNYAVYNRGNVDNKTAKAPKFHFSTPTGNQTDIELEAVVIALKGKVDGR